MNANSITLLKWQIVVADEGDELDFSSQKVNISLYISKAYLIIFFMIALLFCGEYVLVLLWPMNVD